MVFIFCFLLFLFAQMVWLPCPPNFLLHICRFKSTISKFEGFLRWTVAWIMTNQIRVNCICKWLICGPSIKPKFVITKSKIYTFYLNTKSLVKSEH